MVNLTAAHKPESLGIDESSELPGFINIVRTIFHTPDLEMIKPSDLDEDHDCDPEEDYFARNTTLAWRPAQFHFSPRTPARC